MYLSLPNPEKDTMELEVKMLGRSDLSVILSCIIIKRWHYLKGIEGGTEICRTDTQETWHGACVWGRESVTGRLK